MDDDVVLASNLMLAEPVVVVPRSIDELADLRVEANHATAHQSTDCTTCR